MYGSDETITDDRREFSDVSNATNVFGFNEVYTNNDDPLGLYSDREKLFSENERNTTIANSRGFPYGDEVGHIRQDHNRISPDTATMVTSPSFRHNKSNNTQSSDGNNWVISLENHGNVSDSTIDTLLHQDGSIYNNEVHEEIQGRPARGGRKKVINKSGSRVYLETVSSPTSGTDSNYLPQNHLHHYQLPRSRQHHGSAVTVGADAELSADTAYNSRQHNREQKKRRKQLRRLRKEQKQAELFANGKKF